MVFLGKVRDTSVSRFLENSLKSPGIMRDIMRDISEYLRDTWRMLEYSFMLYYLWQFNLCNDKWNKVEVVSINLKNNIQVLFL